MVLNPIYHLSVTALARSLSFFLFLFLFLFLSFFLSFSFLSPSQLSGEDIDYFGLYDCFPICFIRAVEAAGLAPEGGGGDWVRHLVTACCSCAIQDTHRQI